jgi:hypothetical protein
MTDALASTREQELCASPLAEAAEPHGSEFHVPAELEQLDVGAGASRAFRRAIPVNAGTDHR